MKHYMRGRMKKKSKVVKFTQESNELEEENNYDKRKEENRRD